MLIIIEWFGWAGIAAKLGDVGPLLLLAVYAGAAHVCARIPHAGLRVGAAAARIVMWVVVAAAVVVPLRELDFQATWVTRLAITAVILLAAAALVAKAGDRLPQTTDAREELRE